MLKRLLLLGTLAGILAATASIIYEKVYVSSLGDNFSTVVTIPAIVLSSLLGCLLASLGYLILYKTLKGSADLVFNLVFSILSFVTILAAFAAKLPLNIQAPELLPGLVIPMHFFPPLAWLTLRLYF